MQEKRRKSFYGSKKFSAIAGAISIIVLLISLRLYYFSGYPTASVYVIVGILAILLTLYMVFALFKIFKANDYKLLSVGIVITACASLVIWVFYFLDCKSLFSWADSYYLSTHYVDACYYLNVPFGIVTAICPVVFYFLGIFSLNDEPSERSGFFDLFGALFICLISVICSIDMFFYYVAIGVVGALFVVYFYYLKGNSRVIRYLVHVLGFICLLFLILEMAVWGYESNFVLGAGVLFAVCHALIVYFFKGALYGKKEQKNEYFAGDYIEQLEKLKKLKDAGILTDAEFQEQKNKILGE